MNKKILWERKLWIKSKKRAKEAGIPFTLEPRHVVIPEVCPIMGVPFSYAKGISDGLPSLDRVNNALGYVPGNVRVISWKANKLKNDLSLVQIEYLYKYSKGEI